MKKEKQREDWKEGRRRRAWELKAQGWKQKDIAAALGVSEGAVSQWIKRGREGGVEALRRHVAPGAQPKLSAEQLGQLPGVLKRGAQAYGYRGDVWTRHSGGGGDQAGVRRELSSSALQPHPARDQAQCAETGAA